MRPTLRLFSAVLPLLLAACANMQMPPPPMQLASVAPAPPPPPPPPVDPFVANQRAEALRLAMQGLIAQAKLHWRYVLAMVANDPEATREIGRLDALIRMRSDALLQQGDTALMRGRMPDAQLAYLKVLALDGDNQRARARLRELDRRAALVSQAQKTIRDQAAAARRAGSETPTE